MTTGHARSSSPLTMSLSRLAWCAHASAHLRALFAHADQNLSWQLHGKRNRADEGQQDSLEAVALLRSLADAPQADNPRAERMYKCRRCLQPKKGHACPVRSMLKDKLWRGGEYERRREGASKESSNPNSMFDTFPIPSSTCLAGTPSMPLIQFAHHPTGWNSAHGVGNRALGVGRNRLILITKLMQRLGNRIAGVPGFEQVKLGLRDV